MYVIYLFVLSIGSPPGMSWYVLLLWMILLNHDNIAKRRKSARICQQSEKGVLLRL